MKNTLQLTSDNWSYGSYLRNTFRLDIIYTILQYKEMDALYNLNLGKMTVRDCFVEQMLKDQLITSEMKTNFESSVIDAFDPLTKFDEAYIEDLYGTLHQNRISCFGYEAIEKEQYLMSGREIPFHTADGIDQTKKRDALIKERKSIIFALTDSSLFFLMKKDMEAALEAGKGIYVIVSQERGDVIPSEEAMSAILAVKEDVHFLSMNTRNCGLDLQGITFDEELQNQINDNETCLFVYGEDGLLTCKDMLIDSVVYGIPTGYFTRTLTNQHGMEKACIVYVPKNFNVIRWVPIWSRTRISYLQLARLWEAYGDIVYTYTPDELYLKYPQYFLNIYEVGSAYEEAKPDYPIQLTWQSDMDTSLPVMRQFDQLKDTAIKHYLNGFDNVEYVSAYFDENMNRQEIPWFYKEQQKGILVQAIRVGNVKDSYVVNLDGNTVRKTIKEDSRDGHSLRLASNFLFFLTPRLAQVYNEIRKGQPAEQIDFEGGHLDYKLYYKDGKRIETFPLFRKSCIGMMKNGQYLFFNFRMGGGNATINGADIRWEKSGVNTDTPEAVSVYTPFYAKEDSNTVVKEYKMPVGENRVNIVMVQEDIICIRKGPVALSSIGVVLSLEEKLGEEFLDKIGARPLENGYYECDHYDIGIHLDKPEDVTEEAWNQIVWVYGGGLSLILDGEGLCDKGEEAMISWLADEGWMSVMSRQTQESAIHELAKHPRTGVGVTKDGDLVILVYSGRTTLSVGADYKEMVQIARNIFPNMWRMMNVDGGGSSVLGMAVGNSFIELSYPATSADNCAGMVRPINTILCLEP